jgi:hypothetical protein
MVRNLNEIEKISFKNLLELDRKVLINFAQIFVILSEQNEKP